MKNGVTEELLVFLTTLHEQKHLGRTAQRLGISSPTASRLLAEARRVFHDELFVRHGHGLHPTHRASVLAERSARLLESMRTLTEEDVFSPAKLERIFRGACLDNAYPMLVEPMIGPFYRAAPHAGLAFTTHSERTWQALRTGELDFALFPASHLPDEFEHMPLLKTPYVHVVRTGHPLEELVSLEGEEVWRREAANFRRIQIVVHPDTDSTEEGVPGPADIPTATNGTALWTESWLGAFYLMFQSNGILTIPWRTALQMAKLRPMVVLGRASSVPWLEPSLVWHGRSSTDPAMVWLQGIFSAFVRGGMGEIVGDEIRVGRIGSEGPTASTPQG